MLYLEDYADAHERHWEDAEYLWKYQRLPNADYLYGLSAECALKALLEVELGGEVRKKYRWHVNHLWSNFLTTAEGRTLAPYAALLKSGTPFADWDVSLRYAGRQQFSRDFVGRHRDGATKVREVYTRARADGYLQ